MTYYFISLGSNIDPARNLALMLDQLLQLSNEVVLSRIIQTTAEGFETERLFLNAVARIQCHLPADELKVALNRIETELGRDRNDPRSKRKDRVADLDILFPLSEMDCTVTTDLLPPESYVRPLLIEILDTLGYKRGAEALHLPEGTDILWHNQPIGEIPFRLRPGRRHTIHGQRLNELTN